MQKTQAIASQVEERLRSLRRELATVRSLYADVCKRLRLGEHPLHEDVIAEIDKREAAYSTVRHSRGRPAPRNGPILGIRRPGHPLAVAVYPGHCGGRPVVMSSRGVAVEDIVSRVCAGDTIGATAADMELDILDAREAFIVGYVLEYGHLPDRLT